VYVPLLPRLARGLLALSPVPRGTRADVEADLYELFVRRRTDRGAFYAHWRLYRDLASLWLEPRPVIRTDTPRSASALLRDVHGDLRYAVRLFARQPAILILAIAGLSLGLGIATAAFTIVNAAALRGEGLLDPDRAPGVLRTTDRSMSTAWKYGEFLRLREGATRMQVEAVLTETAAVRTGPADADGPSAGVAFVSGGFFAATGGRVVLGRSLDAVDAQDMYQAGSPPVVVSFVFWASRLHRDPAAVGRTLRIGRAAATIVGVAERGFSVPGNRQLWMPLTTYGEVYGAGNSAEPVTRTPDIGLQVFGRLLPGVALAEAEAQLSGVAASLPAEAPLRVRLDLHTGLGRVAASDALAVTVIMSALIALVLVLACANVASVLVSTAITREREMGVRAALGASRSRILRQLVTESLALGTLAAVIGLALAYWTIPMIATMVEAPADVDLSPDLNVYLFLGIVTLVASVGAGLVPAWHGRRVDLVTPLKGTDGSPNRVAPRRLRSMLVMTQAAVSVLLIVLATLFVRATFRAAAIDVGFDADGLYTVSPGLGDAANDDGAAIRSFLARATAELQAIPGIARVTLAELTPFDGTSRTAIAGDGPSRVVIDFNRTHAGYFETLGLRILGGRPFTSDEVASRAPVALVSQSLARAYWHDQSPLGQVLPLEIPVPPAMTMTPGGASLVSSPRPVVIGVVADAITARMHERSAFAVYEPLDPASERFATLMIRIAAGTPDAIGYASQRLRAIDPQADVRIASVAARLQQEAGRPRLLATLTGVVGIVAIVLCVIGLYGLTASVVGQRTREMGVRVAMGAAPGDLLRLLLWDSLKPVVFGLAVGAAAALLAGRVASAAVFFGVSPQDPIAFVGAAVILLAAAMLAVLVPTRRAAGVDAAVVLRRS
jgi:putative ABC transport system permease protein